MSASTRLGSLVGGPSKGSPVLWRSADGATLVTLFVVLQLLLSPRQVISKLPLSLSPASVVALAIGLCWLCAQFTNTLGVAKGRNPVRTMLFAYICSVLATYGVATYGYLPTDELNMADHAVVLALASVGMALGVSDGVRGHDRRDLVLKTVVAIGAVVAVVGILQFLFNLDLTQYMKLPGLRDTSQDGFIFERSALRRVAGTTGNPIEFGVVCAMVLPLAIHFGSKARGRNQPSLRWWACSGLIASGLMFSISRSAILAAAGAGAVLFLGWPARRRLQAALAAVGFLGLMKIIAPGLLGAFYNLFANAGSDSSVQYRTHDYPTASTEIAKHPWLGRGLGTWYAPKHQVFDNQYLLSLVEVGVLGLTALIGIFIAGIYSALRARSISSDPEERDLGLTLAAILIIPIVASATFDFVAFATANALAFLIAGAAGSHLRTAKTRLADVAALEVGNNAGAAGIAVPVPFGRTATLDNRVISRRKDDRPGALF
jgi:O-antigen ligase